MDSSAGIDTEYLTETAGEKRRYTAQTQVSQFRPHVRNTDLALSCELLRLTHVHLTVLESTPVKLSLLGMLHFYNCPSSTVPLQYDESESVIRSRITRDPLYQMFYEWFTQLVGFLNAMAVSWRVWEESRFMASLRKSKSAYASLAGAGSGITVEMLSLVGSWENLETRPAVDPAPFISLFESFLTTLLTLNKDADFSQISNFEDRFYPRNYIVTSTRNHTKIAPAEPEAPLAKKVVLANAADLGMRVLRRPPNPLLRCCVGDVDDELKLELIRVVVTYEKVALG